MYRKHICGSADIGKCNFVDFADQEQLVNTNVCVRCA